jgi:peptidyl-prolyl cis-trans isomerase A (cyclophilin A)
MNASSASVAVRLAALAFLMSDLVLGQTKVCMATGLGEIEVQLESEKAPLTVANFLRYVDAGRYDGGRFHRTVKMDNQPNNNVKIEVIQAGPKAGSDGRFPPIVLERTSQTGLRHKDGVISMARDAAADTATGDFFICIGDQPELDFGGKRNPDGQGFAAFGRVLRGMDVVRKIQQSTSDGQRLQPPIEIVKVRRCQ